ncbi:MAG TPA: hypothetical protein VJK53_04190 [Candidatus Paceibacterota bacterium]
MNEALAMSTPLFLSLVLACAAGFIVIAYESLAMQQGWPVGKLFRNNAFRIIFGGLSIVGSVGFAATELSILWAIGILILGFIAAFILSFLLKSLVQWVALVLLIGSWLIQFFL